MRRIPLVLIAAAALFPAFAIAQEYGAIDTAALRANPRAEVQRYLAANRSTLGDFDTSWVRRAFVSRGQPTWEIKVTQALRGIRLDRGALEIYLNPTTGSVLEFRDYWVRIDPSFSTAPTISAAEAQALVESESGLPPDNVIVTAYELFIGVAESYPEVVADLYWHVDVAYPMNPLWHIVSMGYRVHAHTGIICGTWPYLLIDPGPDPIAPAVAGRLAGVFPFRDEGRYEFRAGATFYRPNRDSLPANTTDTVTVRLISTVAGYFFHVPYWSPFGSEFYFYYGYGRIIQWVPRSLTNERAFMDLRDAGGVVDPSPGPGYHAIERPFHLGYRFDGERVDSTALADWDTFTARWEDNHWTQEIGDSALVYRATSAVDAPGVSVVHYADSSGIVLHLGPNGGIMGMFRPLGSAAPWPEFTGGPVAIREERAPPSSIALSVRPNPANPSSAISFTAPVAGRVRLAVYDANGRRVAVLRDEAVSAGAHEAIWDGRDAAGRSCGSGAYVVRCETPAGMRSARLVLER